MIFVEDCTCKVTRATVGIYCIRNTTDGRVYVGQSHMVALRWAQHRTDLRAGTHKNAHLQHAWSAHGEDSFAFTLLQECSREELPALEAHHIARLGACARPTGYNFRAADTGKGTVSAETCAKISAARLGKKRSPESIEKGAARLRGRPRSAESIAKTAAARRGKKHTEEAKDKIRQAKLGRPGVRLGAKNTPEMAAKRLAAWHANPANRELLVARNKANAGHKFWAGKTHTDETKEKLRHKQLGKVTTLGLVHTEESKAKMRIAKLGVKRSAESIAKQQATRARNRLLAEKSQPPPPPPPPPKEKKHPWRNYPKGKLASIIGITAQ